MEIQKPGSCLERHPHVHGQRCRNLSPSSGRDRHRGQPTGKRALGTHAHAPAQAGLLGSFQTNLRGEPHPCGDLLRCAFLGPFFIARHPRPGSSELEARAFPTGSRPIGVQAWCSWSLTRVCSVFAPQKLLQANSCRAATRPSPLCGPPHPHLPFLGQELKMALYSIRKCPGR